MNASAETQSSMPAKGAAAFFTSTSVIRGDRNSRNRVGRLRGRRATWT